MLQLSNPRTIAVIEDWPSGRNRVRCTFEVEATNRGQRVKRTTTGKPKTTTYNLRMAICDGDDGRIFLIGLTECNQRITLKGTEYYYTGNEDHQAMIEQIDRLLEFDGKGVA